MKLPRSSTEVTVAARAKMHGWLDLLGGLGVTVSSLRRSISLEFIFLRKTVLENQFNTWQCVSSRFKIVYCVYL